MFSILNWPRKSGKTYFMVREVLKDPNAMMLVCNYSERERILRQYKSAGLQSWQVQTPGSFESFSPFRGRDISKVYVDNADLILQQLINQWFGGAPIAAISVTDIQSVQADAEEVHRIVVNVEDNTPHSWGPR